jgi:hypothetical protein
VLWNENRERLLIHFTSRQSLLWWAVKTYWRRKRQYTELRSDPQYAHLTFVHLRSPREAEGWLEGIGVQSNNEVSEDPG